MQAVNRGCRWCSNRLGFPSGVPEPFQPDVFWLDEGLGAGRSGGLHVWRWTYLILTSKMQCEGTLAGPREHQRTRGGSRLAMPELSTEGSSWGRQWSWDICKWVLLIVCFYLMPIMFLKYPLQRLGMLQLAC